MSDNTPMFGKEAVLLIRQLYFTQGLSFTQIGCCMNANADTIKRVALGIGYYSQFTDNIPRDIKVRRIKNHGFKTYKAALARIDGKASIGDEA